MTLLGYDSSPEPSQVGPEKESLKCPVCGYVFETYFPEMGCPKCHEKYEIVVDTVVGPLWAKMSGSISATLGDLKPEFQQAILTHVVLIAERDALRDELKNLQNDANETENIAIRCLVYGEGIEKMLKAIKKAKGE